MPVRPGYRLYGLSLDSPLVLPCPTERRRPSPRVSLVPGTARRFAQARRSGASITNPKDWFRLRRLDDGTLYLLWSGLFEFLVAPDGHRIEYRRLRAGGREAFATYLLSQVLSFSLIAFGAEPLHGTVVVVDGEAVAFLGDCGYGKSTLGAAFVARGMPLLTDDLVSLVERHGRFVVHPGVPRIKLFPAVSEAVLGSVRGERLNPSTRKMILPLGGSGAARSAVPLRAAYVLSDPTLASSIVRIEDLGRARAMVEIVRNTFNSMVTDRERLARQFRFASALADAVPVRRLDYPRDLAALPDVRAAVLEDLGAVKLPPRAGELRRAVEGHERLLLSAGAVALAVAVFEAASVALLVPFLDWFRARSGDMVARLAAALAILALLRIVLSYGSDLFAARLHLAVLLGLRERLARGFYERRYADLAAMGAGRLVNLFSVQSERVVAMLSAVLSLGRAGILLAVYGAALVVLSWRLSLLAAAIAVGAVALGTLARRRVLARSAAMIRADEASSTLAADDAAGLHVIHAYAAGPQRLALHRRANEAVFRETMGLHRWRAAVRPMTEALYVVVLLAGLLVALRAEGSAFLGAAPALLAFGFVLHRAHGQLAEVLEAFSVFAEQEGAALNVFAFVGVPPATHRATGPHGPGGQADLREVGFGYEATARVLDGLDLSLAAGEVVAVVGASGAGKSTMVQLLARLRSAEAGRITVDGVPVERLPAAAIGVVFEDGFVFDESLEWNVTLGRAVGPEAVARVSHAAALDETLAGLDEGLATRAGPRGMRLSAGQRQRVALARALVGEPALLVLDEATSALDARAEARIVERVRALRPRGMTLVVAHRLSTVLAADRVAVLEGGRIIAAGTHHELLDSSPAYRGLVETQLTETI